MGVTMSMWERCIGDRKRPTLEYFALDWLLSFGSINVHAASAIWTDNSGLVNFW